LWCPFHLGLFLQLGHDSGQVLGSSIHPDPLRVGVALEVLRVGVAWPLREEAEQDASGVPKSLSSKISSPPSQSR
jgi:hypothetical protein